MNHEEARKKVIASMSKFKTRDIDVKFIEEMFEAIDRIHFNGEIEEKLKSTGSTLKFRIGKGTKTAGVCSWKQCEYTITISKKLFDGLFKKGEESLVTDGLKCYSRNECLLMTLEHEITHMIMTLYGVHGEHHGSVFQCVNEGLFGHTDFRHNLLLGESDKQLKKEDVKVGMRVKVENLGEVTVLKLNPKTARVKSDAGKEYRVSYPFLRSVVKSVNVEEEAIKEEQKDEKEEMMESINMIFEQILPHSYLNDVAMRYLLIHAYAIQMSIREMGSEAFVEKAGGFVHYMNESLGKPRPKAFAFIEDDDEAKLLDYLMGEIIESAYNHFQNTLESTDIVTYAMLEEAVRADEDLYFFLTSDMMKTGKEKIPSTRYPWGLGMWVTTSKGPGIITKFNPKTARVKIGDKEYLVKYENLSPFSRGE